MRQIVGLVLACGVVSTAAGAGPVKLKDVAYGPHERQRLDLIVPESKSPVPLVIWVHGGSWRGGDKAAPNPARFLLEKGYAVASVNYRFSQHAPFPAQIHDVQRAVRFLRDHAKEYNLDADHFGAWGASAGGHLVALLGTSSGTDLDGEPESKTSAQVQAVCDWFGPTELTTLVRPDDANNVVAKLLGGPVGEKKSLAASADPVTHLDKSDAPLLIVHGTEDKLVPLSQSERLHAAAKKAGVPTQLLVFDGAGHGDMAFRNQVGSEKNRGVTFDFFEKYLKVPTARNP